MINSKHPIQKILLFFSFCLLIISCKKNDDSPAPVNPGNNNNGSITEVPSTFTQKLLIEQYTGAWNGGCPDGIYRMDQLVTGNARIIGVTIHMGDAMETTLFNSLIATFNNNNLPQFPSAMINRISSLGNTILSKTQWASNASVNLSKTATCGLAIKSSVTGNSATVEIHSGFKSTLAGSYHLTVYLVEDKVTGIGSSYDQVNTNSINDPNSPYYNKPTPITGFEHNSVVRKVLTAELGDNIDASHIFAGGKDIKSFTLDIAGKTPENLKIVAFINKIGTTSITHEIMNVQVCPVNGLKDWD